MINKEKIQCIKERLYQCKAVCILTGAGISAESGVPTFRGKDGLWKNYRAEELATPEAFHRNPKLVWEWYNWRRELIASLNYNAAHKALTIMEERFPSFTLITQNVDGLHRKAGSKNIIEIHGNIWMVKCTGCGRISENLDVPIQILPYCSLCGSLIRPNVVWFGEALPKDTLEKAVAAAESCEFMWIIGTSGVVQPAASFSYYAKKKEVYVVEVNLETTPLSDIANETLLGKAGEILPLFV